VPGILAIADQPPTAGSLKLEVAGEPALKIEINRNDQVKGNNGDDDDNDGTVVELDLLEPTFFSVPDDQTSIFDKLRAPSSI
jgi:hypothetical protein